MNEEKSFVVCEDILVPGPVLRAEHGTRYGSVAGLDDDELLSPAELERQVYMEEWAPVLELPVKGNSSGIRPVVDEAGSIGWGAFGTVDFERYSGGFDKVRYKADKVRERLQDLFILISIVRERLPGKAKYMVLKYLKMGIIGSEHIVNSDMQALARLSLRARRMQAEIEQLERTREAINKRRLERLLPG